MKNKGLMWMITGIVAFIAIVFFLIFSYGGNKKSANWTEHYAGSSKDPYGEYLLQELIKDKYTNTTVMARPLSSILPYSKDSLNRNYMFIGHTLYMNEKDQESFLTFVKNGNKAFISARELPGFLVNILYNLPVQSSADSLKTDTISTEGTADSIEETLPVTDSIVYNTEESFPDEEESPGTEIIMEEESYSEEAYVYDTVSSSSTVVETPVVDTSEYTNGYYSLEKSKKITVHFAKPIAGAGKPYTFAQPFVKVLDDSIVYQWSSFIPEVYQQPDVKIFAYSKNDHHDSLITMIGVPYGKGMIYIHSNPILFTNFYLKTREGLDHTEHALSVLSPEKMYWDEFNKIYSDSDSNKSGHIDYLKYILSKESLKWAWYSLIGFALLFILFRSKRKQRIIPVIEPVLNSSLDYVSTTGRLYFQLGSHHKVVRLNMKLFKSMLYQKYGIKVKDGDASSLDFIAAKSGIPKETYTHLFNEYNRLTNIGTNISNKDLHTFYLHLQQIYQKITQ